MIPLTSRSWQPFPRRRASDRLSRCRSGDAHGGAPSDCKSADGESRTPKPHWNRLLGRRAAAYRDFVLEIVRRTDQEPGFKVLPRRWVVERTFGWMTRWERLVRDYEKRIDVSEL
jgi:transposase